MILLDTNVLSEFLRPAPAPAVQDWLDRQLPGQIWTTAVTLAEIRLGLALLPKGRRQHALRLAAETMFAEYFDRRCLPFDQEASAHYAEIVAARRRQGRPLAVEDAQIAAIAVSNHLPLATRNTRDFDGILGLELVDPWAD